MLQALLRLNSRSCSGRRVARTVGAILSATLLCTFLAAALLVALFPVAWFGGFPGMGVMVALAACLWVVGIVYFSITFIRDDVASGTTPSQVASNISLQRDRDG
jgi:fatty acid desaturase